MGSRIVVVPAVVLAFLSVLAPAGSLSAEERADGVRFLPDVADEFFNMTDLAEPLGFHIGGSPDPSSCKHYQAIVRVNGPDGTPFFLVTRSGVLPDIPGFDGLECNDSDGERSDGNLIVFRMGSRPKDGERMRSNRLRKGIHPDATEPPDEDKATIFYTVVDHGLAFQHGADPHPAFAYQHPGGLSLVGNIMAMAAESPRGPDLFNPDYVPAPHRTLVMFFDVSDPEHPVFKSQMTTEVEMGGETGTIAVTPLPDGHYLLLATGGKHNEFFSFYRSDGTDLSRCDLTWTFVNKIRGPEVEDAHQTLTFLREGDIHGTLYLAGIRGKIVIDDHDRRDLYRVSCDTENCLPGESIHVFPRFNGRRIIPIATIGGLVKQANGAAASGFYITPTNELLMYVTEHDNDGPDDTVKAGEWHHHDVAREGSPNFLPRVLLHAPYEVDEGSSTTLTAFAAPPIVKPWIALYTANDNQGLYPMIDFQDWHLDDYDNLANLDHLPIGDDIDFDDEARSWAYYAPVGCSIDALDFEGNRQKTLPGRGFVQHDFDLAGISDDDGDGNMFETVDGVRFEENCFTYYETPTLLSWDTDGDGTFETTSTQVPFSAAVLDGPSSVAIPVEARHPFGGEAGTDTAVVTVRNVPPAVAPIVLSDPAGHVVNGQVAAIVVGVPLQADAPFTDPGLPDHQAAGLSWGDGTVETQAAFTLFDQAFGDGTGRLTQSHRYLAPGTFPIALTVTDDDGGAGSATTSVRALTPAQATQEVIDAIAGLLLTTNDFKTKKALDKALKALAGSPVGTNGALQKISTDQKAAAIASLQQAIDALTTAQENGAAVAQLIALLEQVIAALQAP